MNAAAIADKLNELQDQHPDHGDEFWSAVADLPGYDEDATDAEDAGQDDRVIIGGVLFKNEPSLGRWVARGPVA